MDIQGEQGSSRFKIFLFFACMFVVVHVAVKVVPMYMNATRMEDEMAMKAGVAQVLKDEDILKDLVNKAKELDLPLTAESFIIQRDDERRKMKISTKGGWDVHKVFLWGVYERTFHFAPSVEEKIMNVTL